ncbi:glycosyltransferase family 4 protein [Prochlorococcus marinus XMU1411]|uniref:hypothetical protein n=1 Tax=Prochlorococcus marinus TaxID=1219 RepID=UPI001ADBE619|nr:hypothetical protein [Prochlorococcus marinus]MBO8244270.1 glycosyltransferase family 4 protein [Prochlorococcus marinus XMU1411]MBW3055355.1 hypothetical protein [Prochlorococcus marinus str. MU1411]MCR8537098.1 hypothetical protein [Prochlorococcus marinus CUG1430]
MKFKKIIFLSHHYFPDQSAGATRSKFLIDELLKNEKYSQIWLFCSSPNRYEKKIFKKSILFLREKSLNRLNIVRIWTPYLGQNKLSILLAYSFFFIQALIISFFLKPDIVFATSAKLFTGFLGALISKMTNSLFFLDLRDTFVDNYFYFYRNNKRIILHSIFSMLENFTMRSSYSINLISIGFKELLPNIDQISKKYGIKLTNFTNGIDIEVRKKLENIRIKEKNNDKFYKVVHLGNLGEGQKLYKLIFNLCNDEETINKMKKNNIIFEIYGAGCELNKIKDLLNKNNQTINDVIRYNGFVKKENIFQVYEKANILMLQLADAKSIEYVIPSKIFEYSSTNLPILFGASGFSYKFISQINGSIPFKQFSAKSFFDAIIRSKEIKVSRKERSKFLDQYLISDIYRDYAKHILYS